MWATALTEPDRRSVTKKSSDNGQVFSGPESLCGVGGAETELKYGKLLSAVIFPDSTHPKAKYVIDKRL